MRNHGHKNKPHTRDNESREEDEENYQPVRRPSRYEVEDSDPEDVLDDSDDDDDDDSMRELEQDDLARMQGPDA